MKKRVNETAIARELREHSAFLRLDRDGRSTMDPTEVAADPAVNHSDTKVAKTVRRQQRDRLDGVLDIPAERRLRRHAFDVWDDQLDRLKRLKPILNLRASDDGSDEVSMASMVREAIEAFIAAKARDLQQFDN